MFRAITFIAALACSFPALAAQQSDSPPAAPTQTMQVSKALALANAIAAITGDHPVTSRNRGLLPRRRQRQLLPATLEEGERAMTRIILAAALAIAALTGAARAQAQEQELPQPRRP